MQTTTVMQFMDVGELGDQKKVFGYAVGKTQYVFIHNAYVTNVDILE